MDIKSGRMRLSIECDSNFISFILRRNDIIVGGSLHEDWLVSSLVVATPIYISSIVGHVKNWLHVFGFQEPELLDSGLSDFIRNLPRAVPLPMLPATVKSENKPN